MGIPVLVEGASGAGKSSAAEGFEPNEVGVLNVAGKRLPFRKKLPTINNCRYDRIFAMLSKPDRKAYVIDDSQYLMAFDAFDHAKEIGYQKFTNMAVNFVSLVRFINESVPDDVIVYFLHHTETTDQGITKAKTLGKMIDNQITLEGLFTIVLLASVEGTEHYFLTQNDGTTTAKTPRGMFESIKIPNDLKYVDTVIREFYGMKEETKNAEA